MTCVNLLLVVAPPVSQLAHTPSAYEYPHSRDGYSKEYPCELGDMIRVEDDNEDLANNECDDVRCNGSAEERHGECGNAFGYNDCLTGTGTESECWTGLGIVESHRQANLNQGQQLRRTDVQEDAAKGEGT